MRPNSALLSIKVWDEENEPLTRFGTYYLKQRKPFEPSLSGYIIVRKMYAAIATDESLMCPKHSLPYFAIQCDVDGESLGTVGLLAALQSEGCGFNPPRYIPEDSTITFHLVPHEPVQLVCALRLHLRVEYDDAA